MKTCKSIAALAVTFTVCFPGAFKAGATSLLLDFGSTTVLPADALLSPGHASGIITNTDTSWNKIIGDTTSLVFGNGTAATGISLNLGRSSAGTHIINYSDDGYTVSALGGSQNTGIYTNTSPVKDGIFGGSGGANNLAMGMRLDGLPAGTYTVVFHGRNTSTGSAVPERFYATNAPSAGTFAFSTNGLNALINNSSPANTTGFVLGDNYNVLTVTLVTGDSLYLASEGTNAIELRGFLNAVEVYFGIPTVPAKVTSQPGNVNILDGANATFTAAVSGTAPIFMQWRYNSNGLANGGNISGANSNVLTLTKASAAQAGVYSLFVSNSAGTAVSSNATLTVTPVLNTAQMTNIWSLLPGDRTYLGTGSTERWLAFNPATTNVLLVSRQPVETVPVLDAATGAEKGFLNMQGIPATTPGVSLGLNTVGVADDGVIYGAGLTVSATSPPFYIYRWSDDSSSNAPVTVFGGDPGAGVQPNLRWGDNMVVRGSGPDTQILLAPGTGTNVVLLRTISGMDFQTEIPPAVISVSGVPSAFAQLGIAFGPETNTFWAKTQNNALYLIQFDLNSLTGTVLYSYSTQAVPGSVRGIGVDSAQKFLAGVAVEAPNDNVRIYDVSDLTSVPVLRDQEPFQTQNPNNSGVGGSACVAFGAGYVFAVDANNGIKAFQINSNYVPPSVTIVGQPVGKTVLEGSTFTLTALPAGSPPLYPQWRLNGTNLTDGPNFSGALSNTLILKNIPAALAGNYSLFVSNGFQATATSSNAVVAVIPVPNTALVSNTWALLPGDRIYLGTNSTERGIAYDATTTNLLLVSRNPAESVVVLDPLTGAEKYFLNVSGVGGTTPGQALGLSMIGVADDGVVFGESLTISATSPPLNIYRWSDDTNASNPPILVFAGDPGAGVDPNLRWGDNIAVRGFGPNTQILLAPGTGTNVALLQTISGLDFQTEIPPTIIAVSNVPSGFAQVGLAFGPGTNTFWAKANGGALVLVQFDLTSNTGTVIDTYPTTTIPGSLRGISYEPNRKLLAGNAIDISDNTRIYDVSDLSAGPVQRDEEVFATIAPNITINGTGTTAFGGNYLYALDSNNGLKAFLINSNYVAPSVPFAISHLQLTNGSTVLTWPGTLGVNYRVQFTDTLPAANWTDLGSVLISPGGTMFFTNLFNGATNGFFRIRAR